MNTLARRSHLVPGLSFGAALALVALVVGCGGDGPTTTSKYSCKLNGDCMKCPSADDVRNCGTGKPHACTSTDSSFCN